MREPIRKDRGRLIAAAMQKIPCDLTIENIQLVNMFTGEIYPASVDILDGVVVRVREAGQELELPAKARYDGGGRYLLPGLIDTHMHVESTMMTPENFGRAAVPWGTTAVFTDPHEIANVMGIGGVEFMLDSGRRTALRHYVLAPSCVPAVPALESAGAAFGPEEVGRLLDLPDVVGIAEIMDYIGVIGGDVRMHGIVDEGLRRGLFLQGHAPRVSGKELAAYRLGGPVSDHESDSAAEAAEKLRAGMHINLRASSLADHLALLVEGIREHKWRDLVSICTDDVHARDLLVKGHVNAVVKQVIDAGIDPVEAYKLATFNAAREYGLQDMGAVAPGYLADLQLLDRLDGGRPNAVFIGGVLVAERGEYLPKEDQRELTVANTVKLPQLDCGDKFRLKAPQGCGGTAMVRCMVPEERNPIRRQSEWVELPVVNGYVTLDGVEEDYQFICVVNRYGEESMAISLLKGFGLKSGAFASTVSHDSHNLTVVYKSPEDALAAALELEKKGGGFTVVDNGKLLRTLPLPVAGLMSLLPCAELAEEIDSMTQVVRRQCKSDTSLLATAVMALPVVPGVLITHRGLVDGEKQAFLEVVRMK